MSIRQIDLKEVPGIDVIQARLASIDPGLSVIEAGYDFDHTSYLLTLSGRGREGRVTLPRELLEDMRDNRKPAGSRYSQELHARLTDSIVVLQKGPPSLRRRLPVSAHIFAHR
jgi:hypothetical protein